MMRNNKKVKIQTKEGIFIKIGNVISFKAAASTKLTQTHELLLAINGIKATKKFNKYFKSFGEVAITNFLKLDIDNLSNDQLVEAMANWTDEEVKLANLMSTIYENSYKSGANFLKKSVSEQDKDKIIAIQKIDENAQDYIEEFTGEKVKGITETTKKRLSKDIEKGLLAGETQAQIAKRIRKSLGIASTSRSATIAATEVHNALEAGNYKTAIDSAFGKKTWNTVGDEAVRGNKPTDIADHKILNGDTIPIDQPFDNGLMHPGDPNGPAKEVIRCRCFLTYEGIIEPSTQAFEVEEPQIGHEEITIKPEDIPQPTEREPELEGIRPNLIVSETAKFEKMSVGKLKEVSEENWANYSDEVTTNLQRYTTKDYKKINTKLRKGVGPDWVDEVVNDIDIAMNQSRLIEDTILYRGGGKRVLGVRKLTTENLKKRIGMQFTDKSYVSSTVSQNVAAEFSRGKKVIFKIEAPAGTRAVPINGFSEFSKENEILLDKDTVFEVVGVKEIKNKALRAKFITHEVILRIVR